MKKLNHQCTEEEMAKIGVQAGVDERFFLLRENGEKALPLLRERLNQVPEGQPFILCFVPRQRLDVSFADAAFVNLALEVGQGDFGERCVLFKGLTENLIENIEAAIERRRLKLALLAVNDDKTWRCIGHLENNLRETLNIVARHQGLTALELADQLELAINSASNRLKKLHSQHLVRRESEISEKGLQYIYFFWDWNS